jgi:hypothetical protein
MGAVVSFDSLLRHTLTVKRNAVADPPTYDEYNQPVTTVVTVATVKGLIQPRKAHEVALASQAGAVVGSHVGYMRPLAGLTTGDWIERGGIRYDVLAMPDAAGQGHHLELALQAVT